MNTNRKTALLEGYFIEHTAKKMKWAFSQELASKGIDITVDQWIILDTLSKYGNMSQLELSQKTQKDPPTVTRILDLLQKKEIVERTSDKNDRRRFLISLTKDGKKIVKRIQPLSQVFRSKCYEGLSQTQIELIKKSLETISDNLNK